jgi:hypothetical protein
MATGYVVVKRTVDTPTPIALPLNYGNASFGELRGDLDLAECDKGFWADTLLARDPESTQHDLAMVSDQETAQSVDNVRLLARASTPSPI